MINPPTIWSKETNLIAICVKVTHDALVQPLTSSLCVDNFPQKKQVPHLNSNYHSDIPPRKRNLRDRGLKCKRKATFLRSWILIWPHRARGAQLSRCRLRQSTVACLAICLTEIGRVLPDPSWMKLLQFLWFLKPFISNIATNQLTWDTRRRKVNYELRAKILSVKSAGNSICACWLVKQGTWLITSYL